MPCQRCADWSRMCLSNTCPTCDGEILRILDMSDAEVYAEYGKAEVERIAEEMRNEFERAVAIFEAKRN